jgi:UDP-glucose 4-epimerase
MREIRGCRVLVTGGAGFLGSNVARLLVNEGAQVTLLDNNVTAGGANNIKDFRDKVRLLQGDIAIESCVKEAVREQDVVVHTAFPVQKCDRSLENQYIACGTVGTFNILKEALEQRALVVYASSISVYGRQLYTPIDEKHPLDPILIYGATKLAGEYYCRVINREYGLPVVTLRFSDLYGPGVGRSNAPINFIKQAMLGLPLVVRGGGKQLRSYIYIEDAAAAVLLAIKKPEASGMVFNVGGAETTTIMDLARKAVKITGSNSEIVFEKGPVDEREYLIDSSLAKSVLGFSPEIDLDTGLKRILAWLRAGEQL